MNIFKWFFEKPPQQIPEVQTIDFKIDLPLESLQEQIKQRAFAYSQIS